MTRTFKTLSDRLLHNHQQVNAVMRGQRVYLPNGVSLKRYASAQITVTPPAHHGAPERLPGKDDIQADNALQYASHMLDKIHGPPR